MKALTFLLFLCLASAGQARDVIVIGEVHDNPTHHETQAAKVAEIAPAALVVEMLTREQADAATPAARQSEKTLERALAWNDTGWPDFSMYYPIFAAAPGARLFGAGVTRNQAQAAMEGGFDGPMEGETAAYGLDRPLPEPQQEAREALQMEAHCNALPEDMLPGMVRIQRLRDAMLARATVAAHEATGGPVVVIAGNGHARKDWGMPALLTMVAPDLELHVIGQTESGVPLAGEFDEVLSAPAPDRDNPCDAFR